MLHFWPGNEHQFKTIAHFFSVPIPELPAYLFANALVIIIMFNKKIGFSVNEL